MIAETTLFSHVYDDVSGPMGNLLCILIALLHYGIVQSNNICEMKWICIRYYQRLFYIFEYKYWVASNTLESIRTYNLTSKFEFLFISGEDHMIPLQQYEMYVPLLIEY